MSVATIIPITGTIQRIRFANEQTGYAVFVLKLTEGADVTCTAICPNALTEGMQIEGQGEWTTHPKFGKQIQCNQLSVKEDRSLSGMEVFLGNGCIKGIGPVLAARITNMFGALTAETIETTPYALEVIEGITAKKAATIAEAWGELQRERKIYPPLFALQLTTNQAKKAVKLWGDMAYKTIRSNFYTLIELPGIGFVKADQLARKNGVVSHDPSRIGAGFEHVMKEAESSGHCYLPRASFRTQAQALLQIPMELIDKELAHLSNATGLTNYQGKIYSGEMRSMERYVDAKIRAFGAYAERPHFDAPHDIYDGLSEEQQDGLDMAMTASACIITGLPGTGKTTLVKAIVTVEQAAGVNVGLCAPTGKAARRLQEVTLYPASTIHRLLGYAPGLGFSGAPLSQEVVVVDECSMTDLPLMYEVMRTIEPGKQRLILVGDPNQLPSVGPGQVLQDILASGVIPSIKLEQIQRQGEHSPIIRLSHAISKGNETVPEEETPGLDETLRVIRQKDPQTLSETILDIVRHEQRTFGAIPQVLVPFKSRGVLSANPLSTAIQSLVPHADEEHDVYGMKIEDTVMQRRNNYESGVFNGEIGTISKIYPGGKDKALTVEFEGMTGMRAVDYSWEEAGADLVLSYAITVHKSQGSESTAIILVIHDAHTIMLSRELLYTGVSRAKKRLYICTTTRAYARAVSTQNMNGRFTGLLKRLV